MLAWLSLSVKSYHVLSVKSINLFYITRTFSLTKSQKELFKKCQIWSKCSIPTQLSMPLFLFEFFNNKKKLITINSADYCSNGILLFSFLRTQIPLTNDDMFYLTPWNFGLLKYNIHFVIRTGWPITYVTFKQCLYIYIVYTKILNIWEEHLSMFWLNIHHKWLWILFVHNRI